MKLPIEKWVEDRSDAPDNSKLMIEEAVKCYKAGARVLSDLGLI